MDASDDEPATGREGRPRASTSRSMLAAHTMATVAAIVAAKIEKNLMACK